MASAGLRAKLNKGQITRGSDGFEWRWIIIIDLDITVH